MPSKEGGLRRLLPSRPGQNAVTPNNKPPDRQRQLSVAELKTDRDLLVCVLTDAGGRVDGNSVACRFHEDKNPSGSIFGGKTDGSWLYTCHACKWNEGKDTGDVVSVIRKAENIGHEDALERLRALYRFNRRNELLPDAADFAKLTVEIGKHLAKPIVGNAVYADASGRPVMVVVRYESGGKKEYRPFHHDGRVWKVVSAPESLPLYNLPRLKAARRVYVVEGEKCADALIEIGLTATTSAFGAKAAKKTDWTPLAGKDVIIFPDNDDDGDSYARDVKAILERLNPPARVGLAELPGVPKKGDIVDFIDAHDSRGDDELRCMIEAIAAETPVWTPPPLANSDNTLTAPTPALAPPTDSVPDTRPLWQTIADIGELPEYHKGFPPITSGYPSLDSILSGGFRPGSLYIVAGRTGSAKSTLATNIARRVALCGYSVLLLKLEESPAEAVMRMHAAAAQVNLHVLLDGVAARKAFGNELTDGWELLRTLPIRVSDARDLGMIQHTAREHVAEEGRLIVLDQLSMVNTEAYSAYEKASLVSNTLRLLARDLYVPIVAVSQINRVAAKQKKSGKLGANDLRDSGHLENDAAAVLLLDRPSVQPTRSKRDPMLIAVHVCKNRYGRCTDAKNPILLDWWPWMARIEDRTVKPAENVA